MKCCNDYRIIVSSFVLVYLDPDLKFQTDRIKGCFEVWWLLHFVSPLLPPSFLLVSILFSFFCLLAVLSPSVCLSGGVFRVDASFVFGPDISATSYWCCLYTGGIQRMFVSSALIWSRILPLQCPGLSRSNVQMVTEDAIINLSAFLSLHASLVVFLSHMLWYWH